MNGPVLSRIGKPLRPLILPGLILGFWWLGSRSFPGTVPGISEVVGVLANPTRDPEFLDSGSLLRCAAISLARVFLGFFLAVLTAIPLGLGMGMLPGLRKAVGPTLSFLRHVCPIAWIPIAILVFRLSSLASVIWGDEAWRHPHASQIRFAMLAIIWWGAFFPIVINVTDGVAGVRNLYIEAARVLGAGKRQVFRKVILPASVPRIVTGLRVGLGTAWFVIVAAEIFPGTNTGLGYMIRNAHEVARYRYAFASILVIGALGSLMTGLLHLLTGPLCEWEGKDR